MPSVSSADSKKNLHRLAPLTQEQVWEMYEIERKAFANFTGTFDELEAAIGMLHLGHHVGWRPLLIIHNKRTVKKYEEILEINIREIFPEVGPSASRSIGYTVAVALGNFWKAVSGDIKVDNRREIGKSAK